MFPWLLKYPYQNDEIMNLDWIISHFEEFIRDIDSLKTWRAKHEKEYAELLEMYEEVKKDWDNFINGIWPPSFYNHMTKWWEDNAVDIVGEFVRFVFFALTDDGYFVAYIPENWREIEFDTIIDPDSVNYGRLCIIY